MDPYKYQKSVVIFYLKIVLGSNVDENRINHGIAGYVSLRIGFR